MGRIRGPRRRLRLERERSRTLTIRHRWYAGGIATVISAALVFSGRGVAGSRRYAQPPRRPRRGSEPTPAPADETTPPSDDTAPTDETTPTPRRRRRRRRRDEPAAEPTPAPTETAPAEGADERLPLRPRRRPRRTKDKNAKDAADVGVLTVPAPGPTTAVITVKVGSDRTGITGVTPLAGVVLLLNTGSRQRPERHASGRRRGYGATAGRSAPRTLRATARSPCRTRRPAGPPAGVNRDARFWVVQPGGCPPDTTPTPPCARVAPAGPAPQRRTPSGPARSCARTRCTRRRTRTISCSRRAPKSRPPRAASGSSPASTRASRLLRHRCRADPGPVRIRRTGPRRGSRRRPTPSSTLCRARRRGCRCSRSRRSAPPTAPTPELPEPDIGVDGRAGHGIQGPLRSVDGGGSTNWDRGLGAAAAANSPANNFDVAVVITDGNPTAYNQPASGPRQHNRFRETENGIFSANALKQGPDGAAAPTRVLAFGVGAGADGRGERPEPPSDLGPDRLQRHQRLCGRLLPDGQLRRRRQRASRSRAGQLRGNADRHEADRPATRPRRHASREPPPPARDGSSRAPSKPRV